MKRTLLSLLFVSFLFSPPTKALSTSSKVVGSFYTIAAVIALASTLRCFIRAIDYWDDIRANQNPSDANVLNRAAGYALGSSFAQFLPLSATSVAIFQTIRPREEVSVPWLVFLSATALESSVPAVLNGLEGLTLAPFVGVDATQAAKVKSSQSSAYMWAGFSAFGTLAQVANAAVLWFQYLRLRHKLVVKTGNTDSAASGSAGDFN